MKLNKEKLNIAMADKCYSAKKLSQESGISQITITKISKGTQTARPETIGKIAKALDVSVTDIIDMAI